MDIKGTAVKVTPEFVKARYAARYKEWIDSMPPASQKILNESIYANEWYSLVDSVITPTQKAAQLFFGGDVQKAGFEIGIYSAEVALTGVYKIFMRISTPGFLLSRTSNVFASYYNPSDITIVESSDNHAIFRLGHFKLSEQPVIYRIAGWMKGAIIKTRGRNHDVKVGQTFKNGQLYFTILATWD